MLVVLSLRQVLDARPERAWVQVLGVALTSAPSKGCWVQVLEVELASNQQRAAAEWPTHDRHASTCKIVVAVATLEKNKQEYVVYLYVHVQHGSKEDR